MFAKERLKLKPCPIPPTHPCTSLCFYNQTSFYLLLKRASQLQIIPIFGIYVEKGVILVLGNLVLPRTPLLKMKDLRKMIIERHTIIELK